MSSFYTHMRLYCERSSDGLLGEPFNLFSSLGFFVAGWLLLYLYRKHRSQTNAMPEIIALIVMTFAIGMGSAIFHSFATRGSILFDVIPIAIFVLFFTYVFARDLLGLGKTLSLLLLLLLIAINLAYKSYVFRAIDGYVSYIPTFMFLLALSLYMLIKRHPSALRIAFASCIAFASLYFRTMDRAWCSDIPIGTHFMWHLLNAALVYMLVRELIVYRRPDAEFHCDIASSHK